MRWWRWGAGAMLGATALLVAGCDPFARVTRWKVVVELGTPDGPVSGTSVVETRETEAIKALGSMDQFHRKVRGQAVVVNLQQGPLFALLEEGGAYGFFRWAGTCYDQQFNETQRSRNSVTPDDPFTQEQRAAERQCESGRKLQEIAVREAIENQQPFEVPRANWPRLIRFRDINDPASVEEVDPANLAASFGPGVYLQRITVAVTRDGITEGIANRLAWLESVGRERGTLVPNPPRYLEDTTPIQRVSPSDFSTELYR